MRFPELSPRAYARLTLAALVSVVVIIVTGASVRLTGSGLGCSEWPTCEQGQVIAPLELHAWIEFGNRLFTGVVSIAVIAAVLGSLLRVPRRADLLWWSLGLVAGVMAQAVLGGISVKMELAPAFISAHFLLSIVLVWNALILHLKARRPDAGAPDGRDRDWSAPPRPTPIVGPADVWIGRTLVALSCVVLLTGTLVTGTGPHAGDESAHRYTFTTITDIARIHSLVVWAFLLLSLCALWRLVRSGAPRQVDQRGRILVGAIVLQGVLGYAQYAAEIPAYLVIVHVLGSVLVFMATLLFHDGLFAVAAETEPAREAVPATVAAGVA